MKPKIFLAVAVALACACAQAQVNSGSNGSDGALNPGVTPWIINMADHPNGIYQYTSVNISGAVNITVIPNANNTPLVWLVQSNVTINGTVNVSGQQGANNTGGLGGPGGYRGGNGGNSASAGQGPGGAIVRGMFGANASYGGLGNTNDDPTLPTPTPPGSIYGNAFLIPLIGGSGGSGGTSGWGVGGSYLGAGGGGGAFLIACSGTITLTGSIFANGGGSAEVIDYGNSPPSHDRFGGGGSGGAIRLVASKIIGAGGIYAGGGTGGTGSYNTDLYGGLGRVRFDTFENDFSGGITGLFTQGYQPIIIPTTGQGAQLTVATVGGVAVSSSPTGALFTPDAVLSAQQNNPIPVVVNCANLPLNTQITVSVKPANGAAVTATGYNTTGTLASSTATISIVIPRGGGLIYATAATGN